jgi:hypothetical protein
MLVSKVEKQSLTRVHRSFTSRLFADYSISCTGLLLIPPCVRFLFPSAFLIDVLLRAYRAQSLLVSDCTIYRDYPLSCFISETLSLTEDTPHHLIIALPSCTLRAFPLRHVCYVPCLILVLRAHLCFPYLASFLMCTYRTALPLIPD